MKDSFDIVVIGTGPAASRIARNCAAERSVAVVEAREPGGTCALRGCNPKKVLVRAAELMNWCDNVPYGAVESPAQFSWQQLMAFKDTFVDPIPNRTRDSLARRGVTLFEGQARFTGPQEIAAGETAIQAGQIVIATGARPARIDVPGAEHLCNSDAFLELKELPPRILFIGGGFISFEFAHVAARFGAACTIIDRNPAVLRAFDARLVEQLVEYTRKIGIEVLADTALHAIDRLDSGAYGVTLRGSDGSTRVVEADLVVHGAGRVPAIDSLGLEKGNVDSDGRGVLVNEYMQSISNPSVYAAGDAAATAQPMLSPVASQEGRIVAKNLLNGPSHTADYGAVPAVLYTVPGLSAVGFSETGAREQNKSFSIREGDRTNWPSMRKVSAPCAGYRIFVENETDRILGAHLLGPDAAETINFFAMAIKHNLTARDVKSVLFTYPSFSADVRRML